MKAIILPLKHTKTSYNKWLKIALKRFSAQPFPLVQPGVNTERKLDINDKKSGKITIRAKKIAGPE